MRHALSPLLLVLSVLLLGSGSGSAQAEKLLYRYVDTSGKIVLVDQLPPEAVALGYDIIRPDGRLIETVAGKPTEEELRRVGDQEQAMRLREEEAERLREWDESLLLRYSAVADIEAAKQRALKEIQVRLAILNSNLRQLKRQVEVQQAEAADAERAGGTVPESLTRNIKAMMWRIGDVEEMIEFRQRELQDTAAAYDRDIRRFDTLLQRVGGRR